MSQRPDCVDCGQPVHGTYARCWEHHVAHNQTKPCKDCGEPRFRNHARCEECHNGRRAERQRERYAADPEYRDNFRQSQKAWLAEHPEFRKRRNVEGVRWKREKYASDPAYRARVLAQAAARRYGLTLEGYLEMLDGGCKVCGARADLHIDHDHKCCPGKKSCGKCVRGVLCHNCNIALGHMKEDPRIAAALVNYLLAPAAGIEPA